MPVLQGRAFENEKRPRNKLVSNPNYELCRGALVVDGLEKHAPRVACHARRTVDWSVFGIV